MQSRASFVRNRSREAKGRSLRLSFFAVVAHFTRKVALLFPTGGNEANYAFVGFQMFEPNQALQPTHMLVTIRAYARLAPSIRVADL